VRASDQFDRKDKNMKTLMAAALSLSMLGGTAAMAAPHDDHRGPDRGHQANNDRGDHHSWRRGERLPDTYRARSHYVDYRSHHLRKPPRGYQWVQADNNYALIALTSGLISEIIASR
jgi:Ni/Co efflux regulator RcnB